MKKKLVIASMFLFIGLVALGTKLVLAETGILPTITTACENKDGLLFGFEDGWSNLRKCGKGSRLVNFGSNSSDLNSGGVKLNAGDVAFIDVNSGGGGQPLNACVLKKDNTAWCVQLVFGIYTFTRNPSLDIPSGINFNDVVYWSQFSIVTKGGEIWLNGSEAGSSEWYLMNYSD